LVGCEATTTPFFFTVRVTGSQVGMPSLRQPEMISRGGVTFGRLPCILKLVYEAEIIVFANGLKRTMPLRRTVSRPDGFRWNPSC
jgi:hypothetical protein